MNYFLTIVVFSLVFVWNSLTTLAVPPPDFLFNVGSQIIQIFSIVIVFLSAATFSIGQFVKVYFRQMKHKKLVWISAGLGVVLISFMVAYQEWVAESMDANQSVGIVANPIEQLDKLPFNEETIENSPQAQTGATTDDKYVAFIKKYYSNLGNGKIEEAYAVSKKSVPLVTFKSWYENVTAISIDHIQAIDTYKYSLAFVNGQQRFNRTLCNAYDFG